MTGLADRARLRRQMRAVRRALPAAQRARAQRQFARILARSPLLQSAHKVAVYLAHGHEADLTNVIALARQRHCPLYLPTIADYRRSRMRFVRFDPSTPMRVNRYGIDEPHPRGALGAAAVPVRHLDVVLVPLVAFDARGWRLGSGAGFYDRCLQHLRAQRRWRRPKLIGVGFEVQRVPELEPGPWDVPLDAILTETGLHPARR